MLFNIAGMSFHRPSFKRAEVQPGDVLILRPEPDNPYDENAIAICKGEDHLGYVPRALTESLRNKGLDQLLCEVREVGTKHCEVVVSKKAPTDDDESQSNPEMP